MTFSKVTGVRLIKKYRIFILAILLLSLNSCGGGGGPAPIPPIDENPEYIVRATNSMNKITPITDLQSLPTKYTVDGARGEHEAFQVIPVLDSPNGVLHNVMVTADDLVNGDYVIPKSNVTIFYEQYLKVTEPSDKSGRVGWWPDALVPLTTPYDITGGFPSPFWVDVLIPRDALPGTYTSRIIFTTSNAGDYIFLYTLEVWDITFPKKMYMKSNFGLDQEDIKWAHGIDGDIASPEGRAISRVYADFLAERYISTNCLPIFQPVVTMNPDKRSFTFDFTELDIDIERYLDGYDIPSFAFPLNRFDLYPSGCIGYGEAIFTPNFNARFLDYVEKVSQHLEDRGYLDRCFAQFIDEPYCFEQYEFIRDIFDVFDQAQIRPVHLVPEQPRPDNQDFGNLHDFVDIFVMSVTALKHATEEQIREGAEDKEEWIYTNAAVDPYPSIAIDKQGVHPRIFVWFAYQHDFQGIFYSSVSDWSTVTPWEDPLTFGPGMGNGCNSLLYPGTFAKKYTGQDDIDGPVTSIRLEMTRDGIEDAQLLYMYADGAPIEEVYVIMTDWNNFTSDPEELLRIRREIANKLMDSN